MNITEVGSINIVGLALVQKTINKNGQSTIDCSKLWHQFTEGKYADNIPGKTGAEVYGVYHDYEGDSTKPFSYLVGCSVTEGTEVPGGLTAITIPAGKYWKVVAKGKMPDCVINAWKEIWEEKIPRTYNIDFEVYDERAKDWSQGEVDVLLSVKM